MSFRSPWLAAEASLALGTLSLAEGNPEEAATSLRDALVAWQRLQAPYQVAKTRVTLARALVLLGDRETAEAHLRQARSTFRDLGAAVGARLVGDSATDGTDDSGLTPRELEVLKQIARGMTNRAIATNLTISEKTVANHVGNILGKLGLSSRAAATAYAYENSLV
jgi:DNA-binding NarL/FixJ family response regulator